MTSGIPAQHHRPSLAEQPLYASSGDRYAEVFLRPRPEMGLVELYVLRWRNEPGADDVAQPIREALTRDAGWDETPPGCEARLYDTIVAGRAGVTVDIDLLAGVLERARAQIDSLAGTVTYPIEGEPLVPAEITDRIRADLEAPRVIDGLLEGVVVDERMPADTFAVMSGDPAHPERGGDAVVVHVGPEAGVVHYHHDGSTPAGAPLGVVRPVGLVWAGIRVDELERVGYEVLQPDDDTPCPPLAAGEICGVPEHGVIYVWSRADFDRLAQLSRRLHDARSGRGLPSGALFLETEQAAIALAEAGADSLEVAKALPRGSS